MSHMTEAITSTTLGGRDQDFLAPAARLRGAGIGGLEELSDIERSDRLARMREGTLGSIHSWELVTAVDGPGTRMTVFRPDSALGPRAGVDGLRIFQSAISALVGA